MGWPVLLDARTLLHVNCCIFNSVDLQSFRQKAAEHQSLLVLTAILPVQSQAAQHGLVFQPCSILRIPFHAKHGQAKAGYLCLLKVCFELGEAVKGSSLAHEEQALAGKRKICQGELIPGHILGR